MAADKKAIARWWAARTPEEQAELLAIGNGVLPDKFVSGLTAALGVGPAGIGRGTTGNYTFYIPRPVREFMDSQRATGMDPHSE